MQKQLAELLRQWFGIPAEKTRAQKQSIRSMLWGQIHNYIREQSFEIVRGEIDELTTRTELDVLLGVGCPGPIWEVVVRKRYQVGTSELPSRYAYRSSLHDRGPNEPLT